MANKKNIPAPSNKFQATITVQVLSTLNNQECDIEKLILAFFPKRIITDGTQQIIIDPNKIELHTN